MTLAENRRVIVALRDKMKDYDNMYTAGSISRAEYHARRTPLATALAYLSVEINEPVNYSMGL